RRKGEDPPPQPVIGTFHSQCVGILRRHAKTLGYPKKFSIYDRGDSESVARSVLRELRLSSAALKPGDMLNIIGGWKNQSVWPDQAPALATTDNEHLAASAYRRYQDQLLTRGAMDFDDLLLQTERLLDQHEEVRKEEAGRFDHILVDEYQDTNGSQYRIISALARDHKNLCVVGDDDQSIYGWRGADVTHILNFSKQWPDAKTVRLEANYRSTGAILEMANRLIEFNAQRHDKTLIPKVSQGMRPRILQIKDEETEAATVVREIASLLGQGGLEPRDIAILFRTNEQPRLFENALRKANLPYVMLGSQSFYDRREVKDVLSYLKWIDQPDDEVALLRVINAPPRGLGNKTVQTIVQRAVERGISAWRVMEDDALIEDLPPAAQRGIQDLRGVFHDVRQSMNEGNLTEATTSLIQRTNYMDEIARNYDEPEERERRSASIGEVTNAIAAFEDKKQKPELTGFLADIALAGREMGSEKDKAAMQNAIWLLTLHAAKGLEFPVVYMVGMEDGILPHHRSVKIGDETAISEERRLCYVGLTRAQETLTMTMSLTRRKWGKPRPTQPSRFLYEITGKADNPNKYRRSRS
ncbi:MAG: 3'-5' exonuclease, partial [Planctomycetota bacterium]